MREETGTESLGNLCGPARLTLLFALVSVAFAAATRNACAADDAGVAGSAVALDWQQLPDLPDELGVAGPFVGVHNDALICGRWRQLSTAGMG